MPPPPPSVPGLAIDDDDKLDELAPMEEDDALIGTGEVEGIDQEGVDAASSDDEDASDLVDGDELDDDIGDGDGEDAEGLDVGDDEIDEEPIGRSEDDEAAGRAGADDEGITIIAGDERAGDLGEEGLDSDDAGADRVGGELPPLDGDDDEIPPAIEEREIARRTSALPPWEDAAWSIRDLDTPKTRLSVVLCEAGLVTAAGDALLEIAPNTRVAFARPMPGAGGAMVALASVGDGLRAVARASGAVSLIAATETSPLPSLGDAHVTKLVSTKGERATTFANTDDGEVFRLARDRQTWKSIASPAVQALDATGQTLVALTTIERETCISLSDDEGRTWTSRVLDELTDVGMVTDLAASGDAIALVGNGVWIARGAAGAFEAPEGCEDTIAATFAGTTSDAPLLVLLSRDDGIYLARVDADLTVRLVAELTGAGGDASLGVARLAWDESRGVVFVACGWGLLALGPAVRSGS